MAHQYIFARRADGTDSPPRRVLQRRRHPAHGALQAPRQQALQQQTQQQHQHHRYHHHHHHAPGQQAQHQQHAEPHAELTPSASNSPAPSVIGSDGGFASLLAHHMTDERRGPPDAPRPWMLGSAAARHDHHRRPARKLVKGPGAGLGRPSFAVEIAGDDDDDGRRWPRPAASTTGAVINGGDGGGPLRKRVVERLMGLYRRGEKGA